MSYKKKKYILHKTLTNTGFSSLLVQESSCTYQTLKLKKTYAYLQSYNSFAHILRDTTCLTEAVGL